MNSRTSANQNGFTLVELLVVIAVVMILMSLHLSAYTGGRTKSQGAQCLNNLRHLSLGWLMYAEDNHEYFLCSSDDNTGTVAYQAVDTTAGHQGDNYAWTWSKMDFATNNPYDTDPAADFMLRPLWKYTQNAGFYKCPGDTSEIISNGVALPRIRTYSMNFFLGGYGGYGLSFEDGFPGDFYFPPYTRLTDLEDTGGSPGAANTFLFIEERQDVINTGNFLTDMTGYTFPGAGAEPGAYAWYQDLPGSYHDRAGGISYCDGHAEIHKWTNGTTTPPVKLGVGNTGSGSGKFPAVYSTDVAWMQSVSARPH